MAGKQNPPRRKRVRGHPGVYYRITKSGKRSYEVTYLDSTGKRRWSAVEGDLEAADKALRAIKTKLDQGQKVVPSNRPFEECAWEWFDNDQHRLRPNTRRNYESALRLRLVPRFRRLKLAEIDEDRIAKLIADMERDGKSVSTIRNTLAPLSRILNLAVRRGLVQGNPISRLDRSERPRKAGKAPRRVLERDEIRRLLDSAKGYRLLLSAALNAGLRQAELLGLLWSNIDFANRAIYVTGQLDRGRKEGGVWIKPKRVEFGKTDAAYRKVELIPSDLFKALREHKLASSYSQDEDFVFATSAGTPIDHKDASTRGLAKAKERAKLCVPGKPNLRFHDLRHTYASANIAAGVDVVYLSKQLGHTEPSVTLDTYADLFEAREKAEASRKLLEASYSGLV